MNTTSVQPPRNLLIQMSGAPGSGKSTMSKLLQRSIGGLVIDHDIIRSSLLEDSHLPFDQVAKSAYRLQWALVEDMVKQRCTVMIDSPCNFQEALDQGSMIAKRHGFAYWYVECMVEDMDLLDERLRARAPMKSQRIGISLPPAAIIDAHQGEDSDALFKKWIKNPCRPDSNAIIVDSAGSLEMRRDDILKQILQDTSAQPSDR